MTAQILIPLHAKWFQKRGIDPDTATRYGVCTSTRSDIGEVIAFPFVEHGRVVNHKYRGAQKAFRQDRDATKCFWNHDAILDEALRDGSQRLVITEGEMDALAAIESGFPLTVSVPDGAPASAKDDPVDPGEDVKFSYVHRAWDALKLVKQIVIATDADAPGQALAHELVRRLGPARCLFVRYPDDCKDLNEVLMEHGAGGVARVLNGARLWPVKGLYRLSDYPEMGDLQTFDTGWPEMDRYLKLYRGGFGVCTGVPSSGKSAWSNALATNMALRHGWNIGIGSFESPPKPFLRGQLRNYVGGSHYDADRFIEQRFSFIGLQPTDDEDDADLDWMLDRASDAVVRHGMDMLILDPWNEIEHKRARDESETDYISRALRQLRRFAANYGVYTMIVAHPSKMNKGEGGAIKEPTLYDISGSAAWYNRADHGIVVHRADPAKNVSTVAVRKARFQPTIGKPGVQSFQLNAVTGRYEALPDEFA